MIQLVCNVDMLSVLQYLQPSEVGNLGLLTRDIARILAVFMRQNDETLTALHTILWAEKDKVSRSFYTIATKEEFRAWDEANKRYLEKRSLDPRNAALEARENFHRVRNPSWTDLMMRNVLRALHESAIYENKKILEWIVMFHRAHPTFAAFLKDNRPALFACNSHLPTHYGNVRYFFDRGSHVHE
jgi:hypothetical protein